MFGLGIWELLIILAIILVVFGPKRLKNIGSDLGSAIKGFRTAIKDEDTEAPTTPEKVIEGNAHSTASESPTTSTKSDPNV
ncbi:MAG: twin-arginine translocase TatA/TatE family subunit [Gammaproteobacteria bacterium]|nr:MAG: twin-arginine translocase TatA/TatE family subunit [Gammaproteobacteria bacterium]TDJ40644.1 MAG: twin-arginine translocase TatA/TatE family subunit [Gammaproteobacteria bacterium]TDJ49892.1 MAG: twin-arginine translocase TatA/TatE family subunit [Gemmatimonadota bacterium]